MYAGSPVRRSGTLSPICCQRVLSGDRLPGGRIAPGITAFTRMSGPNSRAVMRVRCSNPALATPCAAKSCQGCTPARSLMFTMAAGRAHQAGGVLRAEERRAQVDLHDRLPVIDRHLVEGLLDEVRRAVDQH